MLALSAAGGRAAARHHDPGDMVVGDNDSLFGIVLGVQLRANLLSLWLKTPPGVTSGAGGVGRTGPRRYRRVFPTTRAASRLQVPLEHQKAVSAPGRSDRGSFRMA